MAEVWSDEPPRGRQTKGRDPDPDSAAGLLLARLRTQPGRWLRIAENVGGGWWFRDACRPLQELLRRRLAVHRQDPVSLWRRDVWARALTPDETDSELEIEAMT